MEKRLLNGRYEIGQRLGAGSMAEVYRCVDLEHPQQEIAIKVLFPDIANDPRAAARLRHDFDTLKKICHSNVVQPLDFIIDEKIVAYTLELAFGGDLSERMPDKIPVSEALRILNQVCMALQAIHDAGFTHRNIKPENILVFGQDVKIADFCIACAKDGTSLLNDNSVIGTIDYVPPEYMLNGEVSWLTDIYSIGQLSYELLTGQSPFRAETVYATMTARLNRVTKPPSELRRECPAPLDEIVLRALEKNPNDRFQSAREMADAFGKAI